MRIKNWGKFQHFKDRKPPWIKLYRDLLDDMEWHLLDAEASKLLVMLWLIASEDAGELPDIKILAFRLRMSEKQVNDCVSRLGHWIEQSDINAISGRYQDVPATELNNSAAVDLTLGETETETETEEEEEEEKKDSPAKQDFAADVRTLDNCPHQQIIDLYHQTLPTAIRVREWTPARAQALRTRWREKPQRQSLEWWERFFGYISESDFLMGRTQAAGRKPFEIDLEWICQSKNFVKVIEGKFHEAKEVAA